MMRALATAALVCTLRIGSALAKDPPSELCSLLTPAQLQSALTATFAAPEKSRAPAPFIGQSAGTHCEYKSDKAAAKVVLIAYVDPSESQAKTNFDILAKWFEPASKPSVGDSAYMDSKGAIHVLKGKVRYFIAIEPIGTPKAAPYMPWATPSGTASPAKQQVLTSLAATVASEL
jgi:hypothetical protein